MIIPQIEQPYEVISMKIKIIDLKQITKMFFHLFYNFTLKDETPLNKSYSQRLLRDNEKPIFPMYSKFLYALQMSEFYQLHSDFFSYSDSIAETLEIRLNLISNKTVHTQSYNKLWMWLMVYQIHYFQTRLQNFVNKSERAPIARQHVEEGRKKIFQNESIELVEDEDDCLF
jgi:hypothetical protein